MTAHRLKCSHPISAVHFVRTWLGVIDSSFFWRSPAPGAALLGDSTLVACYRSVTHLAREGAYDSHHRTAGIAGRSWRRSGGVAARGASAAAGDAYHWLRGWWVLLCALEQCVP